MKKLLFAGVPILIAGALLLVSPRPTAVVHAQTPPSTPTAPADPTQYGYRPAPTSQPSPQPGVPLSSRPTNFQQQVQDDVLLSQTRAASRDAMQDYAKGVIRRARHTQAVRTAGMEVAP